MADFEKIKQAIQDAKDLTKAEKDELVNMLWENNDEEFLMNIIPTEKNGKPFYKSVWAKSEMTWKEYRETINDAYLR